MLTRLGLKVFVKDMCLGYALPISHKGHPYVVHVHLLKMVEVDFIYSWWILSTYWYAGNTGYSIRSANDPGV